MIAVTLLAFAASAVSMPFVAGAASRAEGARRTLAAKLAGDRLEQLEQIASIDYDNQLWQYDGYPFELFPGGLEDGNGGFLTDPTYSVFTRYSNVVPFRVSNGELVQVMPGTDSDFSLITVSVSYDEGLMDVRLSTLIGK